MIGPCRPVAATGAEGAGGAVASVPPGGIASAPPGAGGGVRTVVDGGGLVVVVEPRTTPGRAVGKAAAAKPSREGLVCRPRAFP
ncbi:MAG: hypothetical protein M0Z46_04480 [Actinomycetota bacterium]|nr:hypothetical protein [Actinomycetota bacterium]